ncbi:MAG: uracil-DNA glycosylase [Anaerolineae bacterium]|nr:MAG: uracil-DNA glycosylase [Anaerolineae bacterium]
MPTPDSLAQIASEVSACTRCALHKTRTKAVPGEGPQQAEIMLIGEGPGFNEDQQGRPFVGQAGQFLEQLLALAGLKRSDVWIGNVVKCRPPNNRDPLPEELQACHAYLERQIAVLNPKIIVTLGRFSMGKFFPTARISAIHGQMRRVGERFVIAMFHPAAALHNPTYLPLIKQDFARLPELLETARRELAQATPHPSMLAEPQPRYETSKDDSPKQMRLF